LTTTTRQPPGVEHTATWPAPDHAPSIVLSFAGAEPERRVVDDWLARTPATVARRDVIEGQGMRLQQELAGASDDPFVVPVRIAWLPRERDGERAARFTDLLSLANPRQPGPRRQSQILRHEPDRCRVVVGAPARLHELRQRFDRGAGGRRPGERDFAEFVERQAVLALERAERQYVGLQYKVPRLVVEELEASARFREKVAVLAAELGRPEPEVFAEASAYLEEMVASHSRFAIDAWGQFGRWLSRAYAVEVDQRALERIYALGSRYPLAFLPGHRSYLDPLVLRTALHRSGFAPNHVLGGINVGFWPIGPVARRSGVVFIRRSVRGEPVYKLVLREYMGYLVRKRFNVEWYIEGGRTRTGKLRPPRYGLLNYLVEAYRDGGIEDVMLLPTSIVYDQLYEVGAMAAEEHGARKTPEGIGWLVGYARAQGRGFGKVRVGFGEPLSLREALERSGQREHSVEQVAFEVCHRINRATPITETALVALALLGAVDKALTLEEVRATLAPLLAYVEARELPTTGELDLAQGPAVAKALQALGRHGVVTCYEKGTEPVWSIGSERHLEAAFYRNSIVHFFVTRSIAELVLAHIDRVPTADPVAEGWEEALRIRDVLKFEFFFARKREFEVDLRAELSLMDGDWENRVRDPGAAWKSLELVNPLLAPRVLSSFLEAYLVVAERLAAQDPDQAIDQDAFLSDCLGVAHQYRLQRRLASTESISRELFANGLKLAANRDLLEPGGADLPRRRQEFAAEVGALVRNIARIRTLALGPAV
jgi:glycerol-3-phosphate O-acyltransferase